MKKNNTSFHIFLLFLVGLSFAAFIAIIILAIVFRSEEAWRNVLFDLVCGLLSAIIITGGLGFILDLCRKHYLTAVLDVKQLRDMGIEEVGTGKSNVKDERRMFGTHRYRKNYPYCLKFMFYTGQIFIKQYHKELTKCLNEGCRIQILLANPNSREYLENIAQLSRSEDENSMTDDINHKTLEYLKRIWENTEPCCRGTIEIRYYQNEYINGLRIAKYISSDVQDISYYWINVRSPKQCASKLSVSLKGVIDDELNVSDDNLCNNYEKGFDYLWDKYAATETRYSNP